VLDSSRKPQEAQRLNNRAALEGLGKLFSKFKFGKASKVPDPVAPPHPPPTGGELPATGPPREPDPSQPETAPKSTKWQTAKNVGVDIATGTAGTVAGLEIYGQMKNSEDAAAQAKAQAQAQAQGAGPADPTSATNPGSSTDQTGSTNPATSQTYSNAQTYPNNPNSSPSYGVSNRALGHGGEALSLFGRMLDELD
jgi:hypothetical protein